MNRNDFLKNFIEMRKSIAPTPAASAALGAALPSSKKTKKGSKIREVMEGNIAYIIEETPGKKYLEEHLQKMCDELTAAKMA